MEFFNTRSLIIVLQSLLLFSCSPSYADTNAFGGALCATGPGAQTPSWVANLNSVFSSLEANVNLNSGYYKAEVGRGSDKAYGLIQCRGDVSPNDCVECTRESFRLAMNCSGGRTTVTWQNWCFMRYSNVSFYGDWEKTRIALSESNATLDDPRTVAKGAAMMAGLAAAATEETLMFAKSETEDGLGGKRYGLAQCSRDLKKSDCADCLDYLLENIGTTAKKSAWQIFAVGCFMWYNDAQFYFNTSTIPGLVRPQNSGKREWGGQLTMGLIIFTAALLSL